MLDLPSSTSRANPAHWLLAALPRAQVCQLGTAGLLQLETGSTTKLSAPLRQALHEAPATDRTLVVVDPAGAPWRLRRAATGAPDIWMLQSLADSRRIALQDFRGVYAARLASSLLHELRNPLNALGLQCDLLGRTLKTLTNADALTQGMARVSQMKDRLRDLLERQNSMVGLWLSAPERSEVQPKLARQIDEALRLLRSYGSQREVRLQADGLAGLDRVATPLDSLSFGIVLIALGLLAIDSAAATARPDEGAQVELQTIPGSDIDGIPASLQIRAHFAASALPAELQLKNFDEWLATLALLLDAQPIELSASTNGIELNFRPR